MLGCVLLKVAISVGALLAGFTHVSDDDYARTVIAQQFAHAPRLDPSGTSWLPLPFWLVGTAMAIAGRSLATARVAAFALGATSVVAPYLAMRAIGMKRAPALAATALALALPWNAWLGVATVPEAWSSALLAAAAIAMTNAEARPWAAGALLASSLSRYEAWPACAVFAAFCIIQAALARGAKERAPQARRELLWAAVAIAGPLLWMAWNAYAHGSAIHFLTRVSAFRRASGAASRPLADKLLGYPRALVAETPEAAALGLAGALGLVARASFRARWGWSATCVAAILAFLIVGDVGDGAPTHHPERALAALWWIFSAMGIDAIANALAAARAPPAPGSAAHALGSLQTIARSTAARWVSGAAASVAAIAWAASLPPRFHDAPGNTESEQRTAQIARGRDMAARHVASAEITPCAYEHFALLAAWGEPERAHVDPPLHEPPAPDCPHVVERAASARAAEEPETSGPFARTLRERTERNTP